MFASFSSTEAGCDQCADLTTAFDSPVQNVTNSVNQYAQNLELNNTQQQSNYHNSVMQSNSVGYNQNAVNTLNNNLNNLPPPTNTFQQSNAQTAMQHMVQKAVQKPNVNSVSGPVQQPAANNNKPRTVNQNTSVEPFEVATPPVQVNIPSKLILLNLATVVLLALAVNETFKYYINRSLQMADGTPHYYAFYAVGAVVLACVMYYTSVKLAA
jgi:hypothetical protein